MKTTKVLPRLLLPSLLAAFGVNSAQAAVTLVEKDGWTVQTSGFAELDMIKDSTKNYAEAPGNGPISTYRGRTQFSARNSRIAFNVIAPTYEDWKTRGYVEMDFLGYQPSGTGVSEQSLYGNGTTRMRHLYMNAEKNGFDVLAGQTWSLMGWQPVYFMPTLQVAPLSGEMFQRLPQVRVTNTSKLGETMDLQIAGGLFRPTQRDSNMPDVNLGARFVFNGLKSGFATGSAGAAKAMPASVAVTGTYRSVATLDPSAPSDSNTLVRNSGMAFAADFMVPIIPSKDGTSIGNTLTLGGEYSMGKGHGNEFGGWTGGYTANPLNSAATTPEKNGDIDAGIGGYDTTGNFFLFNITSFNVYLQYHLNTELPTFISLGYGQLFSDNAKDIVFGTPAAGQTAAGSRPYDRTSIAYANFAHNFTPQLRAGFEWAHMETHSAEYKGDGRTETLGNERYQLAAWYAF